MNGAALSPAERARLAELEAVVERAFGTAGFALQEIRDSRLYRQTHPTFDAYVADRWSLSRSQAYRLIDAARVVQVVSPIGDVPANEAQARELVPLLDDEPLLIETWRALTVEHGKRITAKVIAARVRKLYEGRPEPSLNHACEVCGVVTAFRRCPDHPHPHDHRCPACDYEWAGECFEGESLPVHEWRYTRWRYESQRADRAEHHLDEAKRFSAGATGRITELELSLGDAKRVARHRLRRAEDAEARAEAAEARLRELEAAEQQHPLSPRLPAETGR